MGTRRYQNPWDGSDIDNETHVMFKSISEFGRNILDGVDYFQLPKTRDDYFLCKMAFPGSGQQIVY